MDTPSSQKRSPRSSAKSKQDTTEAPESPGPQHRPIDDVDEQYTDRSIDQVARVRAAKAAAQREMESFGDVSEYDITILQGQLREEPAAAMQPSLAFQIEIHTDIEDQR